VVHLATHGQFSSKAEDTFILTWDDRINIKQLNNVLKTRDRRESSIIELLVLSACQTAVGDKRAALGLAGMAVRAGARSTLASLWSINDAATASFMIKFYQNLADNKVTKAEALRRAQLALLQNPEYRHPYFWAPFILVGNWL
jgi:CHAT domain-containing protein